MSLVEPPPESCPGTGTEESGKVGVQELGGVVGV